MNLRVAEQYVREFGKLAKETNTMIIPSNLGDLGGMVATLGRILKTDTLPDAAAMNEVPESRPPVIETPASPPPGPPPLS